MQSSDKFIFVSLFSILVSIVSYFVGYKTASYDIKGSAIRAGVAELRTDSITGEEWLVWKQPEPRKEK